MCNTWKKTAFIMLLYWIGYQHRFLLNNEYRIEKFDIGTPLIYYIYICTCEFNNKNFVPVVKCKSATSWQKAY